MDAFWWGVLLAGRILPVVILVPAFGGKRLPLPACLGLLVSVVWSVFPESFLARPAPGGVRFVGLLLKELSLGAVLALSASCIFEGLRMGGQLIDSLRGSVEAQVLVPQTEERTTPLGDLYLLFAVLVFFAVGGPALFLRALNTSLSQLPVDVFPSGDQSSTAANLALAVTAEAIRMGVSIAFPAALTLLVTDVLLGFMNRTAPQIQVFFLGMPLRAIIGILTVMLTLDHSLERFLRALAM